MTQNILKRIYSDPNSGVAFSHWQNLLSKAQEYDPSIKKKDVLFFLARKPAHTLHVKTSTRHRKRFIKSNFPDDYIAIDLLQLSQKSLYANRPFKFVLCSIDLFSKYLRLIPIRSKAINDVKKALELLFSKMQEVPKKILSDLESSFYSKIVQSFLKNKGITLYSQQGAATLKYKNGVIERAQRTVRQLIAKVCTEFNTENFVKYLPYIETIFNSRKNRVTGFSPKVLHVNKSAIATFQMSILKRDLLPDKSKGKFSIGDTVRYKLTHGTFAKESKQSFSKSIHTIVRANNSNPLTFQISPPPNHKRLLYASDLVQAIPIDSGNFEEIPIERVTNFRKFPGSETLYSCSLIGYPQKEIWLSEFELKSRYVLFPQSLDEIKKKNNLNETFNTPFNSQIPLTRSAKKKKKF